MSQDGGPTDATRADAAEADERPASWLFVEDDGGRVVRLRLTGERLRIGRDRSNDIWLDCPTCSAHTLVFFRREGADHLKIYEGAKAILNGALTTGSHRLVGGDTIRVADREFLYGCDATPPTCWLGVTVFEEGHPVRALVLQQTRAEIGRRVGDILLDDPAVVDGHGCLEFYGEDHIFVAPGGARRRLTYRGATVNQRTRVAEGGVVSIGPLQLRVCVLPNDTHGLFAPLAPARPGEREVALRLRAALHGEDADETGFGGAGATSRPNWRPPPPSAATAREASVGAVPATVIGALPGRQPSGALPKWLVDLKDDRPAQPPRPLPAALPAALSSSLSAASRGPELPAQVDPSPRQQAADQGDQLARSRAVARNAGPVPRGLTRVAPEVFQGEHVHHDSRGRRRWDTPMPAAGDPVAADSHPDISAAMPAATGPTLNSAETIIAPSPWAPSPAAPAPVQPAPPPRSPSGSGLHDPPPSVRALNNAPGFKRTQQTWVEPPPLPASPYHATPPEGGLYDAHPPLDPAPDLDKEA